MSQGRKVTFTYNLPIENRRTVNLNSLPGTFAQDSRLNKFNEPLKSPSSAVSENHIFTFNAASWFAKRSKTSQKALNILKCYRKDNKYIKSIPDEEFESEYQIVQRGYSHAEEEKLPMSLEFQNLLREFAKEYVQVRIQRFNQKDRQKWEREIFGGGQLKFFCCYWGVILIICLFFYFHVSSN